MSKKVKSRPSVCQQYFLTGLVVALVLAYCLFKELFLPAFQHRYELARLVCGSSLPPAHQGKAEEESQGLSCPLGDFDNLKITFHNTHNFSDERSLTFLAQVRNNSQVYSQEREVRLQVEGVLRVKSKRDGRVVESRKVEGEAGLWMLFDEAGDTSKPKFLVSHAELRFEHYYELAIKSVRLFNNKLGNPWSGELLRPRHYLLTVFADTARDRRLQRLVAVRWANLGGLSLLFLFFLAKKAAEGGKLCDLPSLVSLLVYGLACYFTHPFALQQYRDDQSEAAFRDFSVFLNHMNYVWLITVSIKLIVWTTASKTLDSAMSPLKRNLRNFAISAFLSLEPLSHLSRHIYLSDAFHENDPYFRKSVRREKFANVQNIFKILETVILLFTGSLMLLVLLRFKSYPKKFRCNFGAIFAVAFYLHRYYTSDNPIRLSEPYFEKQVDDYFVCFVGAAVLFWTIHNWKELKPSAAFEVLPTTLFKADPGTKPHKKRKLDEIEEEEEAVSLKERKAD